MLSSLVMRLAEVYQPDPFRQAVPRRTPVSLAQLESACRWAELTAAYQLPEQSTPLGVGQLRFSRVFPEMFLQYDVDGSVKVITLDEAAQVVAAKAAEFPSREQ